MEKWVYEGGTDAPFRYAVALSGHVPDPPLQDRKKLGVIENVCDDVSNGVMQALYKAIKVEMLRDLRASDIDVEFEGQELLAEGTEEVDWYDYDPQWAEPEDVNWEIYGPSGVNATVMLDAEPDPSKFLPLALSLLKRKGYPLTPEGVRYLKSGWKGTLITLFDDVEAQEYVEMLDGHTFKAYNIDEIESAWYSFYDLDVDKPSMPTSLDTLDGMTGDLEVDERNFWFGATFDVT
jgi:hypothetical protein